MKTIELWRPRLDWISRMLWHMEHSFSDEKFYEWAYFMLTKEL